MRDAIRIINEKIFGKVISVLSNSQATFKVVGSNVTTTKAVCSSRRSPLWVPGHSSSIAQNYRADKLARCVATIRLRSKFSTYIHIIIGDYNHSVRLTTKFLTSLYILCTLVLYMNGRSYGLKSTSNDRFLRNLSWQFYLLSEFLPDIC